MTKDCTAHTQRETRRERSLDREGSQRDREKMKMDTRHGERETGGKGQRKRERERWSGYIL